MGILSFFRGSDATALDPDTLIKQLNLLLDSPEKVQNEAQRLQLKQLARQASVALETPFETMQRLGYSSLPLVTSRVAQEHQIFNTLTTSNDRVSFENLKTVSGLDEKILESVLDYLGTQDMVREIEPRQFIATKLTRTLVAPLLQDAIIHFHDNITPALMAFNASLGDRSEEKIAFQIAQNCDEDFYTWVKSHPVQAKAFHGFMEAQFVSLPTWLDVVDPKSEFFVDLKPDEAAFVDVGGSIGQQCRELKQKLPDLNGRIILQDRPEVLEGALQVNGMETLGYNFLTDQPVKNARIYYFRQILHNNNDQACLQILKSQVSAMGPNSVIIIDDKVLPDAKPPPGSPGVEYPAALSLAMRVMFNSLERRESHWRQLFSSAGLEIKEIRKFTKFDDCVIIVGKPE